MNELDKLIEKLIEEKGGSRKDYLHLLDSVGYHESAHTMDPSIKQRGGGPGRGIYQFEEGKNRGGAVAARRAKMVYDSIYKQPAPKWIKEAASSESVDASKLSKEQQDFLFLSNMRMHPRANFSDIWDGKKSIEDFWADYHWAGNKRERPSKIKRFKESLKKYQTEKKELPSIEELKETVPQANKMSEGGTLTPGVYDHIFNSYNGGGTHEQNKYGGIPLGMGSNGKRNTVEEGESSYNFKDGKYIFSDRLYI